MPLFSEHIANMYYGSSSPYTGLPYSYSSSVSPLGSSYSASYLNPGGSYSNHSSIGSYSRAPLSSRWITSSGRNYSPMLSTISERGSASPVRINSPRRLPLSSRTYGTPAYTPRPVNINTADIDVSRDKYRHKTDTTTAQQPTREQPSEESENGPFMPRVDGKPETGIDSSPGVQRSTIKRGRTVVRLYTIKRKEKDSPRKPTDVSSEEQQTLEHTTSQESSTNVDESNKKDEQEFMKWREKLSEDLSYKDKREKKTLGAKLVEKFTLKNENEKEIPTKVQKIEISDSEVPSTVDNKCLDRRCSMELLAEQASLLDSLIRSENLSTATVDLRKVGKDENKNNFEQFESTKRRKSNDLDNPLKTTKSDHSLHDTLKSYKDVRDPRSFSKRRSIKKSSSGSNIRRLDSINEIPKETINVNLPAIEEIRTSIKQEASKQKPKPKLKPKITASVEVSPPMSPLKFVVENVTVEEKPRIPRKEIIYSSEVEDIPNVNFQSKDNESKKTNDQNNIKKTVKGVVEIEKEQPSPEPETGNFWDKIGKRETVYLMKRKQHLIEAKEKNKRALFWFPEEEESENFVATKPDNLNILNVNVITTTDLSSLKVADDVKNDSSIISDINKGENSGDQQPNDNIIETEILKDQNKENDVIKYMDSKSILPEQKIKEITETDKIIISEPVSRYKELEMENDKNNLSNQIEIDSDALKSKVKVVSQESKNIGKSASLETINENKVKVPSQKKTKSEKSKKALKVEDSKSMQPLLPKPLIKTKALEKPNTITERNKIDEVNKKQVILQDALKSESVENNQSSDNKASLTRTSKDSPNKHQVPCPIHPFGLKKSKELNLDLKLSVTPAKDIENLEQSQNYDMNNSDKQKPPCPVHPYKIQQVKDESISDTNIATTKDVSSLNLDSSSSRISIEKAHNEETTIKQPEITNEFSEVIGIKEIESNISNTNNKQDISKSSSNLNVDHNETIERLSDITKDEKIDNESLSKDLAEKPAISIDKITNNKMLKKSEIKTTISDKKLKEPQGVRPKEAINKPNALNKISKTDETKLEINSTSLTYEEPSTSSGIKNNQSNIPLLPKSKNVDSSSKNSTLLTEIKLDVPDKLLIIESQDIPNKDITSKTETIVQYEEKTGEENKAENIVKKDELQEKPTVEVTSPPTTSAPKRPIKEEKALRPLIATPRPLQKKAPQVIHSDSSDSSSEEESSEEEDSSESSEGSAEFFECENNPDGRTSTGSNDSGFDSSAPASPATFSQIKKDCDVNCHRKCEKLTANLCGVNQRLLVEALASRTASKKGGESTATSSSSATQQQNNSDILEQELEQSTAYDIFRKTGRFTPPARSIPRFRKYTVEDFQFIKVLGKGSFGKVLLAELRDTEYYYAVKCLKKDVVLEDDDVECTLIERKVLALGTNHPYLCHLFATFQTDSHLFFVMEYLNGGDLMFHIQQSGRFPESRARFYAAEIVSGLKFLHKRGIVYRDLKLDNILLDFEGHVRIADFGMCKLQIYLDKTADTFCGTPDYMAPEIIKGLKYNQTVDWWSFGVLLYEMLIGQSPFSGCDEDELFWSICNEMPSYPRFLSQEALAILTRLLDKDARTRLGGTECMYGDIRDQEFFHSVHWDKLERRELEAPFRPRVRHPMDTQYFDRAFTGERPRLTAVEPHVLRSMDQEPFRGFSYTNPNTTDR